MDETYDEDEPDIVSRPTWSRFDDFVLYMSKMTLIKGGLTLAILTPMIFYGVALTKERRAEQARKQLEQDIQELNQGMRERVLGGEASKVELRLLGISPEEYEPMRAAPDAEAPPADPERHDPPPPRPDF